MANKDDIRIAEMLATLIEWRKSVDDDINEIYVRVEGMEKWQTSIANARKLLIPYMTFGAIVALALSFIVFSLVDPVSGSQILKSLIKPFI